MSDIDPQQAARMAQGGDSVGADLDGGGSLDESGGRGSSILDRLFDGSASGPNKDELVREYALEDWSALILRGVLRAAPGDGMPPLGDISLGGILGIKKYTADQQAGGDRGQQQTEFEEDWGER